MLTGMFAGGAVSMVLPSSFVALFYGLLASVVFVYLLLTSKKVQKWISKYKPVKAN
jgi:uncharacterized membrane protein YfcA